MTVEELIKILQKADSNAIVEVHDVYGDTDILEKNIKLNDKTYDTTKRDEDDNFLEVDCVTINIPYDR